MIEKLRALTSSELETMAGEILRSLSASASAQREAFTPEAVFPVSASPAEAAAFFPSARPDAPAALTLSAVPAAAAAEGRMQMPSEGSAVRFTDYALPPREERGITRAAVLPAMQTPDAEALSDFFRRDSRRYDGGFERF